MNSVLFQPADAVPFFPVEIAAPDLSVWRVGNTGLPGFWSFTAVAPGPHVALTALLHGNEIAVEQLLEKSEIQSDKLDNKYIVLKPAITLKNAKVGKHYFYSPIVKSIIVPISKAD